MTSKLTKEKVNLPDGWEVKKLIDIGEVQTGTTPSTKNKDFYGDFIPFVKPPHFNPNGSINFSEYGLSELGLSKGRLIKEKSILMVCIGASIGKTGITEVPVSCNQQINTFTPYNNFSSKYFYHLLSSDVFFKQVLKLSSQATLPMINKTKWQNIEVAFPPLPQQKQIVAVLDKAFVAIDTAKANAEQNIKNAKELFESYLQNIFENKGDEWEEKTFENIIASSQIGIVRNSKQQSYENSFRYFKMNNILNNNGIKDFGYKYIEASQDEIEKYRLYENDFLFNTRNSPELVGKSCLYTSKYKEPTLFNNNILRVTFKKNLLPQFIAYAFSSKTIKDSLELIKSGTTGVSGIYYKNLKNLNISFPSTQAQKKIITKLNALSAETKKLEAHYTQKISDLDELKKSILQKAFSGQLT